MPLENCKEIKQADIYVLQGDDSQAIQDIRRELSERLSGGIGDLNVSHLDARTSGRDAVNNAANMLPLGGTNRIFILEHAPEAFNSEADQEWFKTWINGLSETTVLVLIVEDEEKYRSGKKYWENVGKGHWFYKIFKESEKETCWLEKPLPPQREMPEWIILEARRQGGEFHPSAAVQLADLIGSNTTHARSEVAKALSYVNFEKPVTSDVVRLLCPPTREENIFKMMDAAGKKDARTALRLMNNLLRDESIERIFSMTARQVRLLIIAREIVYSGGGKEEIREAADVPDFVAGKLIDQARRFQMEELQAIYRRLDRIDEGVKTGRESMEVALETLITAMSQ